MTPTPKALINKQDYRASTGIVANSMASPNSRSGSTNTNNYVQSLRKRIGGGAISSN